jgi:DNA-binding XRE family transcriptional regulator
MKKDSGSGKALTGAQVRMARAALGWTISDTASKAGIGTTTIKAIEAAEGAADAIGEGLDHTRAYRAEARREALERLRTAFEAAGVTFASKAGAVGVFAQIG